MKNYYKIMLLLLLNIAAKSIMTAYTVDSAYLSTYPLPVPQENTRCLLLGGFLD